MRRRSICLGALSLCAIARSGLGIDCDGNGVDDWQEPRDMDCDGNGVADECQLVSVDRGFVLAGTQRAQAILSVLELGDVDGDLDLDVVAASPAGGLVVFLNDGAARLEGPVDFEARDAPRALVLADLDRDGDLDAATANGSSVSFLRGDGAARFSLADVIPIGSGPVAVTAGDFDLDGDEDVVTLNDLQGFRTPGNVSLLRNDGSGTFGPPLNFAAGVDPAMMRASDIDHDGDLDLVISTLRFIDGTLTSLRNDGGSFSKMQEVPVGWRDSVVLADLVGDGSIDAFGVNHHLDNLYVFMGEVSGSFRHWSLYWRLPFRLTTMAAADLEGDGDGDVIAGSAEESAIVVFRNDQRHFTPTRRMPAGLPPRAFAAGDLDGDGAPDLAVAAAQGVTVLRNVPGDFGPDCNGNGLVDACEPEDCNGNSSPDSCDVAGGLSADCDSNGVPDECDRPDCNGNRVPDRCDVENGTSPDCNRNGTPDACEADCNRNRVPDDCDTSAGTSEDCNQNRVPDECEVAANDCNANGLPDDCDVAETRSPDCNGNGVPDECDLVSVFRLEPVLHEVGRVWPLVRAADLDGDGMEDLVTADRAVQAFLNLGDGSFRTVPGAPLEAEAQALLAADLDGDGDPDAAIATGTEVAVFSNDGLGRWGEPISLDAGERAEGLAAADLDGDGDLDLASVDTESRDLSLFLGDGRGEFTAGPSVPAGALRGAIAAADLDGDGRIDLLSSTTDGASRQTSLAFAFNSGAAVFSVAPGPLLPGLPWAIASADLDGDGLRDLVVSVATCGPFSCSGEVIAFRHAELGAIIETSRFRSGFESLDLALADLDGDGDVDLVSLETFFFDDTGGEDGNTVTVRLNDGTGAFTDRHDDHAGAEPRSVAVLDLTGSGLPELAVGSRERIWVLRNDTGPYSLDRDGDRIPDECLYPPFDRGDANGDGDLDITDPIRILLFLFGGADAPGCLKAADADDSGKLEITDAIRMLLHLFAGTETIPEPFEGCGLDRTEDPLGCEEFLPCA